MFPISFELIVIPATDTTIMMLSIKSNSNISFSPCLLFMSYVVTVPAFVQFDETVSAEYG